MKLLATIAAAMLLSAALVAGSAVASASSHGVTAAKKKKKPPVKPKAGQWNGETSQIQPGTSSYEPITFTVDKDRKTLSGVDFWAVLDCDGNPNTTTAEEEQEFKPTGTGKISKGKFKFKYHKGKADLLGFYPTEITVSGKFKKVKQDGATHVLAQGTFNVDTPSSDGLGDCSGEGEIFLGQ